MATAIGVISELSGTAKIQAADGGLRDASVGAALYPEEVLITEAQSEVTAVLTSGEPVTVGEATELRLDETVYRAGPLGEEEVLLDVATLQQVIAEGGDLAELFEDPAAAGTGDALDDASVYTRNGEEGSVDKQLTPYAFEESNVELPEQEPVLTDINEPPLADPVFTYAGPISDEDPAMIGARFEVNGIIDGLEDSDSPEGPDPLPSLGGLDAETPLDDLIFEIRSVPSVGDLFIVPDPVGPRIPASPGTEFTSSDKLVWEAETGREIIDDLSAPPDGVTIEAEGFTGFNGEISNPVSGKFGVDSNSGSPDVPSPDQASVPEQLGFRLPPLVAASEGESESITVSFGGLVTDVTVSVTNLIQSEGEVGKVESLNDSGEVIDSWTFSAVLGAKLDGESVDFNIGGDSGSFTLSGQNFSALRFTATEYADNSDLADDDSSDYFIQEIAYTPIATFTYVAVDGQGAESAPATVIIQPPIPVSSLAPIAIDLDGDGVDYVSRDAGVTFADDEGAVETAWVDSDDALLVIDANGSGTVDDSREYVFTEWSDTAKTDMQAVREVFDSNQDGVLDAADEQFGQFAIWQDADADGVTDWGELHSLLDAGIESIALNYSGESAVRVEAGGDVLVHGQSAVTWADGRVTQAEDAAFAVQAAGQVSLADVLDPGGAMAIDMNPLEQYLSASYDANTGDTTLGVYAGDAQSGGMVVKTIVLQGVDASDLTVLSGNQNVDLDQI